MLKQDGTNMQPVFQDELERELEELEQEELDKELLGVGPSVDELPSVPTTDIAKPTPTKSKASGYLYLQFMLRLQKESYCCEFSLVYWISVCFKLFPLKYFQNLELKRRRMNI